MGIIILVGIRTIAVKILEEVIMGMLDHLRWFVCVVSLKINFE